jgi:hypothetical protein
MKAAWFTMLLAMTGGALPGRAPGGPRIGRRVGEIHPQIVLPSLDGRRPVALSSLRGKKVLLVQFASW